MLCVPDSLLFILSSAAVTESNISHTLLCVPDSLLCILSSAAVTASNVSVMGSGQLFQALDSLRYILTFKSFPCICFSFAWPLASALDSPSYILALRPLPVTLFFAF